MAWPTLLWALGANFLPGREKPLKLTRICRYRPLRGWRSCPAPAVLRRRPAQTLRRVEVPSGDTRADPPGAPPLSRSPRRSARTRGSGVTSRRPGRPAPEPLPPLCPRPGQRGDVTASRAPRPRAAPAALPAPGSAPGDARGPRLLGNHVLRPLPAAPLTFRVRGRRVPRSLPAPLPYPAPGAGGRSGRKRRWRRRPARLPRSW